MVEGHGMSDFIDEIASYGFTPPRAIVWDGKIHRFPTSASKPQSKDGWYVAHDDHRGKAGAYGSMRDAVKHTWGNGTGRQLTADDLKAIDEQREAAKKAGLAAKAATAIRAQRVYAQAGTEGHSDYLTRKKMGLPEGCKFVSLLDAAAFGFQDKRHSQPERPWHITGVIVPMQNSEGKIVNLQIIGNGMDKKLFMPESTTAGAFHMIGGAVTDRVVVAEGIATAQAILPHSRCPVAIAFSANNLPAVARIMRAKYPTAEIILAADGDAAGRDYSAKAVAGMTGKSKVIEAPDGKDFWDAPFPDLTPNLSRQELMATLLTKTLDDGQVGKILPRIFNYREILTHGEEFTGRLAFDLFAETPSVDGKPMDEDGVTNLVATLESKWISDKVAAGDVERAARASAKKNAFHPVLDYLNATKWDGVERIDQFFPDHLHTPSSPYFTGASRCLFIGAVKRILVPGCQMDSMVVLESPQGLGKSRAWEVLGGEWYLDQTASIESVDFFIAMRGKWFVDLGELDQFQRAEITRVKQVITLRNDDYRAKYARDNERKPRQSIFVGGTNSHDWIADSTGGRRFLPIRMGDENIDVPRLEAARDQLFAEAVHRIRANDWPDWWLVPDANEQQESRMHQDFWDVPVAEYLAERQPSRICGHEILTQLMRKELGQITKGDETKLGSVMKRLGWERRKTRTGSNTYWAFYPPK
jgi:putative DNA primase/helicase